MTDHQKDIFDKMKTAGTTIARLSSPHSVQGKVNALTPKELTELDEATTAVKDLFKQLQ